MKLLNKYLLLALTLTLVQITFTESRLNEKRRLKERTHHSPTLLVSNICDITDRESKVHCYCENTQLKTATKADCWVFNGGIEEDDGIWISFASQPFLERLSFNIRSDGALTFVPVRAFHRHNRLQHLTLRYASIHRLPPHAFANSSSIRELSLMKNKITELAEMSFAHMRMLSNVTLNENKISEIKREVFYDIPNLQRLYLSSNNISVVHDGCFEHLNNLIDLELDANSISVLTRESFKGLSNLVRLDLRSNRLEMIGDLTFVELWNLKDLLLDNNDLSYVSGRAFDGLSQLSKLSITGNKLHSLNEGLLEGVRGLALLDLRNNELESLTYETVRPIVDNMKSHGGVMYLEGNLFTCDCRLSWVHVLWNDTKSESLRAALDHITCIMDPTLHRRIGEEAPPKELAEQRTNPIPFDDDEEYEKVNENFSQEVENAGEEQMYDDPPQSMDDPTVQPVTSQQKNLINIPIELLPCPKELIQEMDESLTPSQDEVKYYRKTFSAASNNETWSLVIAISLVIQAAL